MNSYNPKQLKDVILRRLGAPVINIEVTEEQVYECIQRALDLFGEYHYDGTHKTYKMFYIGDDENAEELVKQGVFDLSGQNVYAVTRIVRTNIGSITSMDGNATYPWFNDFLLGMAGINGGSSCNKFYGPNGFGADLSYFTQLTQYCGMMQNMMSPIPDYWYNSATEMLKIMGNFRVHDLIVIECYVTAYADVDQMVNNYGYGTIGPKRAASGTNPWDVSARYNNMDNAVSREFIGQDPVSKQGAYNDRWVKDYATALVKEINGQILARHQGMALPGGVTVDGNRLLEEARYEKEILRRELELLDPPFGILIG